MEYATAAADGVAKATTSTVAPSDAPSRRGAKSFEAVAQAIAQPTAGHRELAALSYCTATAGPAPLRVRGFGSGCFAEPTHLYLESFVPSDASKWRLNLFILHGQSGYVGRYYRHFPRLLEQGVGIFAFDYRGHGRSSGGQRGLLPSVALLAEDASHVLAAFAPRLRERPTFVMGVSNGAMVALQLMIDKGEEPWADLAVPIKGFLLLAPFLQPYQAVTTPKALWRPLWAVARCFPKLTVPAKDDHLKTLPLSRCPENFIFDDPLVYTGPMSLLTGLTSIYFGEEAIRRAHEITAPFFILCAEVDYLAKLEANVELHERAASADKTIKVYEGAYHALLIEPEECVDEVWADALAWMGERCGPAGGPPPSPPPSASGDALDTWLAKQARIDQLQLQAAHRLGRVALARGWQAWVDCHLETLDRRLAALDAHIDAAAIAAEEDAWARAEFGLDA